MSIDRRKNPTRLDAKERVAFIDALRALADEHNHIAARPAEIAKRVSPAVGKRVTPQMVHYQADVLGLAFERDTSTPLAALCARLAQVEDRVRALEEAATST